MLVAGLVVFIAGWLLLHFLIHLAVVFATVVIGQHRRRPMPTAVSAASTRVTRS